MAASASSHCVVRVCAGSLTFEQAAKLLSKTGSTAFPGAGNSFGYAAQDASGEPTSPCPALLCIAQRHPCVLQSEVMVVLWLPAV